MSLSVPRSEVEYKAFMRNVTGLSAVAVFPMPEAGRVEFAAVGLPVNEALHAIHRLTEPLGILRIEAHLVTGDQS